MLFIRRLKEKYFKWVLTNKKLTEKRLYFYHFKLINEQHHYPTKFDSHYKSLSEFLEDVELFLMYTNSDNKEKKESNHGQLKQVFRDRFLEGRTSEQAISLVKDSFFKIYHHLHFGQSMSSLTFQAIILNHQLLKEYSVILKMLEVEDGLFTQRITGTGGES